jgi:DNA repair protein RecO (recombination protein O)
MIFIVRVWGVIFQLLSSLHMLTMGMDWRDEGIILSARRHGETSAIVHVLTRDRGVHAGLVKGGYAKRQRSTIEPGNRVYAAWRARLAEHLGHFALECTHAHGAALMDDPDRLAAMSAALAVAGAALPEREPHPATLDGLLALLDALEHIDIAPDASAWGQVYVRWELGLLSELGFRLDLSHCASTGVTEDLVWVSPKSGRAVSAAAGEPFKNKLLALPGFLRSEGGGGETTLGDIVLGLKLSGYFLERHLFAPHDRAMPQARARFVDRLMRQRD